MRTGFHDFALDVSKINFQPVDNDILIQHLSESTRGTLSGVTSRMDEPRLENVVMRQLMDRPDISYPDHADLLYKLAGQVVARVQDYLPDEDAVKNVLQFYERQIGELVHAQLTHPSHVWENEVVYEATFPRGFEPLPP